MICDTHCTRVQSNHLLLSHSCIVFHALLQSLSCHPHPLYPIVSPSADCYSRSPFVPSGTPPPPSNKKKKNKKTADVQFVSSIKISSLMRKFLHRDGSGSFIINPPELLPPRKQSEIILGL